MEINGKRTSPKVQVFTYCIFGEVELKVVDEREDK